MPENRGEGNGEKLKLSRRILPILPRIDATFNPNIFDGSLSNLLGFERSKHLRKTTGELLCKSKKDKKR